MEYKDYYKILDVEKKATHDEIKRAYRKLARKLHPDVNKAPEAEVRFKEIGEAYEVLKDPEKRAAYDRLGSGWREGQEFKPPPNWDTGFEFTASSEDQSPHFSDFFEELFGHVGAGRGFHRARPSYHAKGEDHFAKILISLEDSFHGASKTITLSVTSVDQTGRLTTKPHTLSVKIPKGIIEGQRIRLTGQGEQGFGNGPRGDLFLEIVFEAHPFFTADKRDLLLELPVAPWEAALGHAVVIPAPSGKVELKIPPGSQSGQKLRLSGKGIPGSPPGDLYVVLKIMTPKADSPEAKALYQKMAAVMPFNPRALLDKY